MIKSKKQVVRLLVGVLLAGVMVPGAHGHETRPAYLELKEVSGSQYTLEWRMPVPLALKLPAGLREVQPRHLQGVADMLVERRWLDAGPGGLTGQRIEFVGLDTTTTNVMVRLEMLDGKTWTTIVRPPQPWVEIAAAQSGAGLVGAYVVEGIRHIIFGVDHLLFVLGLLLIVKSWWMLIETVTAFTVAHSITLAVATFGYADAPSLPLNAAIALSILFLGPEIVRVWRGQTSFTIRHPWVVAFVFGLIHGFGFASALTNAGLSRASIPIALLSFNVGVEIGQISFIVLVYLLERAFRQLEIVWPQWVTVLPGYTVGTLGAYWTIQRTAILLGLVP